MSKVAVLKTSPQTVLDDYEKLLHLAEYDRHLPRDRETILKLNISWQHWYPACSTAPWQIDGTVRTMLKGGYGPQSLIAAQNRTVVVDAHVGEVNNKHKAVVDKHQLQNIHLYEPGVEWITYQPKGKYLVLDKIYPEGVRIPRLFLGRNIIHFPTLKTHVFTTITGAMKNAFGGLLSERRHWTHGVIHETLVDLLMIQKEIHTGIFAVMDGTFAGEGPGPRAMDIHQKDLILASGDQVAIDAVAARLMGFDPMSLPFIRLAHDRGLGVGDPRQIQVVGEDVSEVNWHFRTGDTFASWGQKLIYHGPLRPFEKLLLRTPLVPWAYAASNLYYNGFWYPLKGKKRAQQALNTSWGRLFQTY
ncbi:MAG: DUF362 domain-containing protein [Chloroflexota bacterium]